MAEQPFVTLFSGVSVRMAWPEKLPKPAPLVVEHLDGNPLNNTLSNLRVVRFKADDNA